MRAVNDVVGLFCFREDLYSKTLADSITTPPMLIVFYKHHSNIDPMWHVRHLGKERIKAVVHKCKTPLYIS